MSCSLRFICDCLPLPQLTEEEHLNRLDYVAAALRCGNTERQISLQHLEPCGDRISSMWLGWPAHSISQHLIVVSCTRCRQWGMVGHVKEAISARRDRPRVGKAISILLNLDPEVMNEWFA